VAPPLLMIPPVVGAERGATRADCPAGCRRERGTTRADCPAGWRDVGRTPGAGGAGIVTPQPSRRSICDKSATVPMYVAVRVVIEALAFFFAVIPCSQVRRPWRLAESRIQASRLLVGPIGARCHGFFRAFLAEGVSGGGH